jgi:hypothetical protein
LKVEHRLGEVLAATVRHGGHNKKQGDTVSPCSGGDLPEQITKKQSSRAQRLAQVPFEEIAGRIDAKTAESKRTSSRRTRPTRATTPRRWPWSSA